MIGWSVAVPTLIGVAIGWWIDRQYPSRYSCTLMCLVIGLGRGLPDGLAVGPAGKPKR